MAHDSENAREWFEQKPEPTPGQMDLFGKAAESGPDGNGASSGEKSAQAGPASRRTGASQRAGQTAAPRPASTQRPPERPMTVAEVVDRKLRG